VAQISPTSFPKTNAIHRSDTHPPRSWLSRRPPQDSPSQTAAAPTQTPVQFETKASPQHISPSSESRDEQPLPPPLALFPQYQVAWRFKRVLHRHEKRGTKTLGFITDCAVEVTATAGGALFVSLALIGSGLRVEGLSHFASR
jgi:hypothetical protein